MVSIRARSDGMRSRLLSPRELLFWICLLIAGLALSAPAASQQSPPPPSDAARSALEDGRRLGKLDAAAFDRLLERFRTRARVRILVGLQDAAEPYLGLSGAQARGRAARLARRAAIARVQARVMSRPGMRALRRAERFRHVPYMALEVDAEELRRLSRQPEVTSIRIDERLWLSLSDTVPQVGADLAWLQGFTGNGQIIAILDGGFDTQHTAFSGRIVDEACFSTTSSVDNTTSLCPNGDNPQGEDTQLGPGAAIYCTDMIGCDHGTHVAGIAAGDDSVYRGIAPDAGILPIQVFSRLNDFFACGFAPSCLSAFLSDVIRGLEHVYDLRDTHEIAVVNMSLGGAAYTSAADCDAAYPALKAVVDNLRSVGITTVAASGNEYHTGAIATPACVSGVVSVGAVDLIDTVADFSNGADYLDTLSPGVGIVSAVPGDAFDAKSGTSMASPGMAGAVAVLRSADPGASPDEIVDAIKTTGVPISDWRNGLVTPRVQVDAAAELLTEGLLSRVALALIPELSGLDEPVGVTHAGDGSARMFILQRAGTVLVRDGGVLLPTPFVDVSTRAGCCAAGGLLGLAFHPDYATSGRVFVSYLTDLGDIVVERYSVSSSDPNRADSASVVEIIRINSSVDGHHGGRIHFGPDDYLYIATGDGAEDGTVPVPGASGDPARLLGKILRIDVDAAGAPYAVPPDNPLVGTSGAREEIWALGLRDPRRFSFDALSGELYVADVGETDAHEVNVQAADSTGGEDYGWNIMEGSACRAGQACDPTGLELPVAEYGFDEGCAITGGVVYRGAAHADLYGAYLFGDLCSGRIWGLRLDDGVWQQVQITQAPVEVSAFGNDENGEAYLVDRTGGQVYRLEVSDLSIDTLRPATAYLGVAYDETLSASGGSPPYQWSIVDGALPSGLALNAVEGRITGIPDALESTTFTVQVQDDGFAMVTRILRLSVTPPPLVIGTTALPDATIGSAFAANLEASGGTPPYGWSISGGALPPGIALGADGALSGAPTDEGVFNFIAKVTDAAGEEITQALKIAVFGPTLSLQLNVTETGEFGHGYGTDQHLIGLQATFTGTTQDLSFHVTGYDIDFVDELAVYLNGTLLGHLSVGPNNGLNARDAFTLPAGDQVPGENRLQLRNKTVGWIWGVTDLLLSDQPAPLTITTTSLPDATFGEAYSVSLEAAGGRTPRIWSLAAGALPTGLALASDGTLSGTPGEQGVFDFTARVTDDAGNGISVDQALTLVSVGASGTVEVALELNSPDGGEYGHNYGSNQHNTELYAFFTGTGTDLSLQVTGYDIDFVDELAVYLNGSLLGHLSVGPNNQLNTGDTFAIPAGAQLSGANQLHFKVKTAGWTWGVTGLLLSDQPAPLAITTTALPDATFAEAYSVSLEATGGRTPHTWSLAAGALPTGLALAADGTLSGTPGEQGVFDFTARVTDDAGASVDQALTLSSVGASGTVELVLELNSPDDGEYGHNYGSNQHDTELYATFTGTGTDLSLRVTGYDIDYVDELAVYLNGSLLGHLSVGPNNQINAGDTFAIPAGAQLSGANQLHFKVKTAGWTWGVTGLLLSDQPAPLAITTTALPDATFAEGYSVSLEATGGRTPHTWSLVTGALPSGLALAADGTLSGTPSEQGVFDFTARVTDDAGASVDQALTLSSVGASGTVELVLEPGVTDTGEYGHKFGSSQHKTELYASFAGTGTDLSLQVTGYDIDYVDELAVYLNGSLLGHLSVGPNNGFNSGDTFAIPAGAQLSGANQLHFKVKRSGWIWGVTDLLLAP